MGTQDKLERVLRDIHVMISKSELYDKSGDKIIVEKKKMFEHLNHLNDCIYEMMEEYEVTKQSREKGDRKAKKKGDEIIFEASRNAEDIYAASILYSNEALQRVQDMMAETGERVQKILEESMSQMDEHRQLLKSNQLELKSQLEDMVDTEKYLKIIEERNLQLKKEKDGKTEEQTPQEESPYASIKPEIHINEEYFRKAGIPLDEVKEDTGKKPDAVEVKVDLDAEYFKWKNGENL